MPARVTTLNNHEALNVAVQRHNAGDLAQAQDIYRQVLANDPNRADAWHLLGVVHFQTGDAKTAVDLIKRAIAIRPVTTEYYYNLGVVQLSLERREDAASTFHRAAMLPPSTRDMQIKLTNALYQLRQFPDALSCVRQVISKHPEDGEAVGICGKILVDMGRFGEARDVFGRLVALGKATGWSQWCYASLLLMHGDFVHGWPAFECRLSVPGAPLNRGFAAPQWDGGDIAGKTLLIHAEGGHGDAIQFIRYLPMLGGKGARLLLEIHPALVPLVDSVGGVERVIGRGEELPAFDVHVPLPSLAGIFKMDLANIPGTVPYLTVPADRAARWAGRVEKAGGLNVGLCWAGNQNSPGDKFRTRGLDIFAPLAEVAGVRFYSLQVGEQGKGPRPEGMELIDFTAEIGDFADTAALVEQLDLVISVDTSVAHLAGALGRPVWTLITFVPDYRWLLDRDDSPWYPTMRLFRQTALGDWTEPVARLTEALRAMTS